MCINYTNEKLQAYFTSTVFRLAQEVYAQEGIKVAQVSFRDNDAQVALVDGRPMGLLALLEEECFIPKVCTQAYSFNGTPFTSVSTTPWHVHTLPVTMCVCCSSCACSLHTPMSMLALLGAFVVRS